MNDLSNRVALVTGGSRGIGRAIAVALAKAGADVAVNYNTRADEAEKTCARIRELSRRCVAIQADVSVAADVARLAESAEKQLGGISILVNNAGNRVFLKRLEFAHEKEVRIAKRLFKFHKNADANIEKLMHKFGSKEWLDALYDQPDGINHPVQLHRLLNRVIVHPKAEPSRRAEMQEQLTRCGLICTVVESKLSAKPFLGYSG